MNKFSFVQVLTYCGYFDEKNSVDNNKKHS